MSESSSVPPSPRRISNPVWNASSQGGAPGSSFEPKRRKTECTTGCTNSHKPKYTSLERASVRTQALKIDRVEQRNVC